jgi:DNA-binding transcriptional ArsR family regulator
MSGTASAADPFHAIAESNRRVLLDALRQGEQPVGALVDASGLSYSLVSQHLRVLLDAGVVERRPDGRRRIYGLQARPLRAVHDWTVTYEAFWQERVERLERRLDGR